MVNQDVHAAFQIVPFEDQWRADFRRINVQWLSDYFFVTSGDEDQLTHPERILDAGGMIFFAVVDGYALGTVAAVPDGSSSLEIAKMGVDPAHQNRGVGKALLQRAINWSLQQGYRKIHLETASQLKAAILLYEKAGFLQVGDEHIHPVFRRKTFRMELSDDAIRNYLDC